MGSPPVASVLAAAAPVCSGEDNQRRHYRHRIRTLAYVNVDSTNGGILRDLSQCGIAMQATAPLRPHQEVLLRFALANPHVRIEAKGRVAWTDSLGQAGIEFLDLPARSRRLLKEWLFTQILAEAYLFSPCDSVSDHSRAGQAEAGLLFSASPRPAIRLEPSPTHVLPPKDGDPQRLRLPWCPVPVSAYGLSRLLDGLLLWCAVLLFAVISLAMTNILPSWPVAVALTGAVTVVFAGVYWFLFVFWSGITPGQHLMRLAGYGSANRVRLEEEDRTRFR
jgi:hypothetical protein